ncbi:MAG: hypothetical protein R2932_44340 [Caldilineaceae bacterium]
MAIDGDVHCWGSSSRGQLGTGTLASSRTPARVAGLGTDSLAIAAGEEHSCAILTTGAIRCWGSNRDRQLGEGSPGLYSVPQLLIPNRTIGAPPPVGSTPLDDIPVVALGRYHTCLITPAGGVQCWGRNSDGQLGNGSEVPSSTPTNVTGLASGVLTVALGAEHSCALHQSGVAFCWGSNQYGQLGDGSTEQQSTPVAVTGASFRGSVLVAGANHTCALLILNGGTVQCWGQNDMGQLGNGTTTNSTTPTNVSGISNATALQAGLAHTCALVANAVKCWGANESGQLGDGTQTKSSTPVTVKGLPAGTIRGLTTGDRHSCANVDNAVYCWGDNGDGQLGDGSTENRATPVAVQGVNGEIAQLSAGASHTCARTIDQALYCWGGNEQSQLGDGTTEDRATAAVASGLADRVQLVSAGGFHNCVLVTGNRPLCWGNDSDGQVATGVLTQSATPLALGAPPPAAIMVNTTVGRPGSTFTLIGSGFAPTSTLPIVVNGSPLTTTVESTVSGEFIVYLESADAEPGAYELTVGNTPSVQLTFLLPADGPLRVTEGGGNSILLPQRQQYLTW